MRYSPHDYQVYTTQFILEHPVSAIFLDMGLGKSVITLSAIFDLTLDSFLIRKVLVIAPLRVARDTWPAEIEKWDHLRGLTYSVAVGSEGERKAALGQRAQVYLINRENVEWLVSKSGLPFDYDMVVIDELSSFKSHQAKRFKSLLKVRPGIKRIVGLTGTPTGNGLLDLWAPFRLLDQGQRLGRYIRNYRAAYFVPVKGNGRMVYSYKAKPGAEAAISRQISDITISMKGSDYLQLPERVLNQVPVQMSEEEAEHYRTMKQQMVLSLNGQEIDAANAAALSGKLLQMANGAVYADPAELPPTAISADDAGTENPHLTANSADDVGTENPYPAANSDVYPTKPTVVHLHDRKLEALEDLIESANGKPVLIAYWFRHDRDRILARFPAELLDRAESIRRWNAGEIPIALIHPASAGHGLNLQAGGSTLIWFGLTWSLELYQQTNARLWRQGQRNTVVIHHLITEGTLDEQVIDALKYKDKTQAALIAAVKVNLR